MEKDPKSIDSIFRKEEPVLTAEDNERIRMDKAGIIPLATQCEGTLYHHMGDPEGYNRATPYKESGCYGNEIRDKNVISFFGQSGTIPVRYVIRKAAAVAE